MTNLTITEALAELKVIEKRVQKKREFVQTYMARQEMIKDPHAKDGGSVAAIARELQAIGDLSERAVRIRHAINAANLATQVNIGKVSRCVADWIVWRRDVAPGTQAFLQQLFQRIEAVRKEASAKGLALVADNTATKPTDLIININEQELATWREELDASLETLDGQLSLKNATTTIEA